MEMRGHRKVRIIEVNFEKKVRIIKSLQGVNDGPLSEYGSVNLTSYYLDLNVPYIRLHDFWNAVDINHVFPDMDADPTIPENYDFSQTDRYLSAINSIEAKIIYRLGYSWEEPPVHNVPPEDYEKWASICVHIIKHYNDDWADGCHYNLQYWEIWNEPDISQFWTGTAEGYYRLYEIAAKTIKDYDPSLKVGGPALAWNISFLEGFLEYCKDRDVPLDFVSWHIYSQNPYDVFSRSVQIRELLQTYGFQDVESMLTEWNIWPGEPANTLIFRTVKAAAFDASALIYLQDSPPGIATFYRGDTWEWGGLFNRNGIPRKAYYAFKAFRMLLNTPIRVFCNGSNEKGLAVIAGLSEVSRTATILISNFDHHEFNSYDIRIKDLPWEGQTRYEVYILDSNYNLEPVKNEESNSPSFSILEDVEVPSVCLIRLTRI